MSGPLIAPTRTLGLGGATIGLGEGVEGTSTNPAAPSVREPFSVTHVDVDGATSLTLPGFFAGTDFENRGSGQRASAYDSFLMVGASGMLQVGSWGGAMSIDGQSFRIRSTQAARPDLSMQILRYQANVSRSFFGDQLSIGIGLRAVSLLLSEVDSNAGSLVTMAGVAPQLGVLVRPDDSRVRLGASVRAPVFGSGFGGTRAGYDSRGIQIADGFVLPRQVVLPTELELGLAVQVGPRELNARWQNPYAQEKPLHDRVDAARAEREVRRREELRALQGKARADRERELMVEEASIATIEDQRLAADSERLRLARLARYENTPRARIMVVASVLAVAPTDGSVAVSSFLSQRYEPYGQSWTLTPRFGLESEPVVDRLVVRVGGYVEPARFVEATPRQHLTFGGDVKLVTWDFFGLLKKLALKVTLGVDLAPRYTNWGLGLGVWH